jgi:GDP-4-dehydro-6-deoxy-D-mannose reductase
MRILVTGATSFTARHLWPLLAETWPEARLFGTGIEATAPRAPGGLDYRQADVGDRESLKAIVKHARPTHVFHLAGISHPDADLCYRVNLEGTRNLIEGVGECETQPLVVMVSSAAVYGLTRPEESPVVEETPLRPAGAYGSSKAAAEIAALAAHRQGRARVIVARPFNLLGPGLPLGLAASDFLVQALAIRAGAAVPELRVGNLEPQRDFVDVRDVVRAYVLLAGRPDLAGRVFNVASGVGVTIRALLEGLLDACGVEATITVDPERLRPVQVTTQAGSPRALLAETGWSPEIPLDRSLSDMAAD